MRPRRTSLTVPGSNLRMVEKAAGLAADEIVIDLEDGVAPSDKDAARENLHAARKEFEQQYLDATNPRGASRLFEQVVAFDPGAQRPRVTGEDFVKWYADLAGDTVRVTPPHPDTRDSLQGLATLDK